MGTWLGEGLAAFILAVLKAIFSGYVKKKKDDEFYKEERETQDALNKAQSEYDTTDLQKQIGEKL